MKKEILPFTEKHLHQLKQLKKEAIARFNNVMLKKVRTRESDLYQSQVHDLSEKIFEYENVVAFNKYASNKCKFSNSDDSEEACEKVFKNTLKHFSVHGNCCSSCSIVFYEKTKHKKEEKEVKKELKYFVESFVIPNNDID